HDGQARGTPTYETEFSHRTRAKALAAMAAEPVDVLVVGGGITGAGIARDAALRGFRTAVVDKGDFASGTSSHSSRLIHGGLRYLEQYEFHLVREASQERRVLLTVAPHLVHPLPFVLPSYRGARVPAWRLRAGLWLYDLLAGFRNVGLHRWLGRKATLRLEPGLRDKDLKGAALYFDAQTDDARLTLATVRAAAPVTLVLPWAELRDTGTTDTDDNTPPEDVRATGEDVIYLLRSANWFFPTARLSPRDVVASWAGLRPLLRATGAGGAGGGAGG